MIDFVPKTIQLLLDSLKRIANGDSTPQWVSLITTGRYDERSSGTLQLLFRYIKSCFIGNSQSPENSILPWPFTLFKRVEAVFFPSFTTLCLALLPTTIAMVGLWYTQRQKHRALAEENDKIISHTNQEERSYKADVQCTQPTTAIPEPIVSASPSVLQPVTAIPAPIVSASPSVLQPITAIPAPIGPASPTVLQPVTAIPAPIVSASPSVLQPVTAIPAPIVSASPSVLQLVTAIPAPIVSASPSVLQPITAIPAPIGPASPTVLQPVTAIPAPIVSASPSVLQPVTAIPAPIVSASPSVLQLVTAIPAPIVSASPSVLQPVTAIPAPIGSASPSVLRATSLGNDCTCKNKEKPGSPQLKFIKILGQGNQAFIHKVQLGNSIFAAKICFPDTPVKDILNEFEILRHLSHKNIIAVNQALPQGFIMELCQTDLFSIIKTYGRLPPGVIHETGSDIINGVSYLHSKGIAHLDIKPRNILLTKHAVAKIADFGLALPIQNDDGSIRTLEHEFRGSFYYAPPDMFMQSCPIKLASCDSWSMGATLFFIMTGNIPFEGETELELVQNQLTENFNIPESLTNTINNDPFYNLFMKLIKGLCTRDTSKRFSIDEAKDFYGKLKL